MKHLRIYLKIIYQVSLIIIISEKKKEKFDQFNDGTFSLLVFTAPDFPTSFMHLQRAVLI